MKEAEQQRVVAALGSTVEEIRHQAVRRLPEVFEQLPVVHLMQALGDPSWRVRKCAGEIIVEFGGSPAVIEALVKALGDGLNAGLRNSATEVLVKIGAPAVPALCRLLAGGDKDERKFAADILGATSDGRALDCLLSQLGDPEENVRAAVAEALGSYRQAPVVERLLQLLGSDTLLVQLSCLDALDRLGVEVPFGLLRSLLGVGPLRPHLFRLMGGLRDPMLVPTLLQGLQAKGRAERAAAAHSLVSQYRQADTQAQVEMRVAVGHVSSDEVVAGLKGMLAGSDGEARVAAAQVLGWTGRLDVVPDLIRAASDPALRDLVEEAVLSIGPRSADALCSVLEELGRMEKVLAVELLGHFRQGASFPWIIDLCLSEDAEVAEAAQRALGNVGNPSVITTLVGLLKRGPEPPPPGAVGSLVLLGASFRDEVVAAVLPLLSSDRPGVRLAAAEVVCGVARKVDLEAVIHLIGDQDPEVRTAAVKALGRVGEAETIGKLRVALTDESPKVRAAAARALRNREEPEARVALQVALADADPWVVKEALAGLGQSRAMEAADAILPFLRHPDGVVALEAVRALNQLGWTGDVRLLEEACRHQDPEVVKEALTGCSRWPAEEARKLLLEALSNPRWDVRMTAVKKIGELRDPDATKVLIDRLGRERDDLVRQAIQKVLQMDDRGPHSS